MHTYAYTASIPPAPPTMSELLEDWLNHLGRYMSDAWETWGLNAEWDPAYADEHLVRAEQASEIFYMLCSAIGIDGEYLIPEPF